MATIDQEGYISIVDRKKDIIISGGENISSIEVEWAILAHPSVLEAAVIGIPDEKWGEVPKTIIVLKPGERLTENDLIQYCQKHLSRFKIPKSLDFVGSLPKSGTSKILKRELREKYWKGLERLFETLEGSSPDAVAGPDEHGCWLDLWDIQGYFNTLDHSHLRGSLGEGIKGSGSRPFSACKIKNELVYRSSEKNWYGLIMRIRP